MAFVPDKDAFCGRGGKDVIPLYRDAAGTEPNVTAGLLAPLGKEHGAVPSTEELAAYVCALLGGQSYSKRFWNELETPGLPIPMTKNGAILADAVKLGDRLIWLHTYAACFRDATQGDEVPKGKATTIRGLAGRPPRRVRAGVFGAACLSGSGTMHLPDRRLAGCFRTWGVSCQGRSRRPNGLSASALPCAVSGPDISPRSPYSQSDGCHTRRAGPGPGQQVDRPAKRGKRAGFVGCNTDILVQVPSFGGWR
ncbi:MAG: hypothetical protein INF45_06630 [Rhodobacter sp.]|nr:hypothetical protein [Rhodobacter sp.]